MVFPDPAAANEPESNAAPGDRLVRLHAYAFTSSSASLSDGICSGFIPTS
jgi:hypothetical protein